ncbi:hypothetical protein NKR23_g12181 [Pleurostoma richardsiae]|uniref:Uncharacterized protein n=1 Tax=Pleurostoma richardsiae TaxID=41990 RepID=A0AA38VFV0_9PEZI|nr:hypothetical protein NKR23_g12181 [Pleurostoma richardsiae]
MASPKARHKRLRSCWLRNLFCLFASALLIECSILGLFPQASLLLRLTLGFSESLPQSGNLDIHFYHVVYQVINSASFLNPLY